MGTTKRKRGRPPVSPKPDLLSIRIPPKLHDAIAGIARCKWMTKTALLRLMLENEVRRIQAGGEVR